MAVVIEDGSGVIGAQAYVSPAFVLAYLTARNRHTAWAAASTAETEAGVIAAADYIEARFSQRFNGQPEFPVNVYAKSVLTFTAQPSPAEVVVIDGTTFTFDGGVAIGTSLSATIDNLVTAINAAELSAAASAFYGDAMLVTANDPGTAGNSIAVSTDTTATWSFATLNGGNDQNLPQPLSFPRAYLYDARGYRIYGIPTAFQWANAEYASRALAATLLPDPTVHESGRTVTTERVKVGPIETEYGFTGGTYELLKSYPAADRLLLPYLNSGGGVIRG